MLTVLYNAKVRTVNPEMPIAQAVAFHDGRILAVGTNDEVLSLATEHAQKFDISGRTVAPGFNDCHMHVLPYGLDLAQADLSPAAGVTNVETLIVGLQKWADKSRANEWVQGNRYDQNLFPGALHPTRTDLDRAFPDRPVYCLQTSKHAACANSVALKLAGITRDTPNPDGGEIARDVQGEPTGVLLESAMGLVSKHIPRPDKVGMVAAIRRAHDALVRVGVTSASDLNTGWFDIATEIECYQSAAAEGGPVRVTLFPHAPEFGTPAQIPIRADFAREYGLEDSAAAVRLGPIKLFSDGALTVRTAALREPYVDGAGLGMLLHDPEELRAYVVESQNKGWQVAIHAIGDRATELVLSCYDEAQEANDTGRRHRIEHAMLVDDVMMDTFVRLGVIPVVQPEFLTRLGDAYVLGLGFDRASGINPNRSMNDRGLMTPFSSDCPIVPGAPLDGMRAAYERTTRTGVVLGPDERVSLEVGLYNYTYAAAYCSFDEAETGTIEPGKRADLIVLSHDPMEDISSARVDATIARGDLVFGSLS